MERFLCIVLMDYNNKLKFSSIAFILKYWEQVKLPSVLQTELKFPDFLYTTPILLQV